MKQRVVTVKAQDPLVRAMSQEWSAKEHQDAMERANAAIEQWREQAERPMTNADPKKRVPSFRAMGIDEVE